MTIDYLQIDRLFSPLGIDSAQPELSWHVENASDGEIFCSRFNIRLVDEDGVCVWERTVPGGENCVTVTDVLLRSASWYKFSVTAYPCRACAESFFLTGAMHSELSSAQWITHLEKQENSYTFRKNVSVKDGLLSARLFSSALGNYDVFVEGRRAGTRLPDGEIVYGELKPGFTEPKQLVHYETDDVTYLFPEKGTYTLSAVSTRGWWLGKIVGNHESQVMNLNRQGEKNAFIAVLILEYADGTRDTVVTDTSWKTGAPDRLLQSDIYDGETVDLTVSDAWKHSDYDDSALPNAVVSTEFHGLFSSMCGHTVRERKNLRRIAKPVHGTFPVTAQPGEEITLDLGQNIAGTELITLEGERGTTVTVRHSEYLDDDGKMCFACNRDAANTNTYILDDGISVLTASQTYCGFQFLSVSADRQVKILGAEGKMYSAITKQMETGTISTDVPLLNKLISNTYWTQLANFNTVPTDCPQRDERHAFTGDVTTYARAACYFADVYHYLEKWILEDVTLLQHTNGSYPSTAPQSWMIERYGKAGWSDGGVIIPCILYEMTGNKHILEKHLPSMRRFMDWLDISGPDAHYGDWATPYFDDNTAELKQYMADAYHCIDYQIFGKICEALGLTEDAEKFCRRFVRQKEIFTAKYTDEHGLLPLLNSTQGVMNQTACVFALAFDLITDEKRRDGIITQLRENLLHYGSVQVGIIGISRLMYALSYSGLTAEAQKLLMRREFPSWGYEIDHGATTVWEYWDGVSSRNHFADASVLAWVYSHILGISQTAPGFKEILIRPEVIKDGEIHHAEGQIQTWNGRAAVSWTLSDEGFTLSCRIPALASAVVELPFIGGVCTGGNAVRMDDRRFRAAAGEYEFCVKL